ncbi:PAS domain-containing sensor histidine kinase [Legionella parisiensis]|uniref:histidine kinase n=1 Tax=Legionella parisiensis TaxID=45071 RepID=A0A1E5JTI3_9GAMM|nr:PAS domain-containing sensor histidine kinase [Legionella parisiensis]KTD40423.1 sensory histidine-kinase / response regulator [Legionella parisiensis]OEH47832.1 Aerobic respiration control sensor protein ArcB [Legionella parisiensis]STX77143.1 sensory histidine-kinase / response regulator [Legionella parisiensis]
MSEKKAKIKISNSKESPAPPSVEANPAILASILKELPGSIYWKDKNGVYLGCNDIMLEMTGMKSVIGKTDFDMPWAASAETIRNNDLKVMALNSSLELEETGTLANGQQAVVLTRKTPLRDEQGNVVGILGISLNITHRKKQEADLRSSQERTQSTLENILANMPGHVYWKDKNGVYLGCNNRQAQSVGFQFGYELIGKTDFDLPWGDHQAALFRQNDLYIMQTGETEIIEEKALIEGKNAIFLSHKSPMRNKKGEITGVLGISINITDRKKIEAELKIAKEKAEAASLAKTEFLENMRHDIRTPLTGIVGFADLIKAEAKSDQIKEYADNLVASSHALLDFMDEVLEAIHVSSGEVPKVRKKFVLQRIVQHVINLNKAKASAKHLRLSFDFDPNIPNYLIGDPVRIHRILLELIANSLNFTDTGFVKLTAKLAKRENREIIIQFIVEDSGMGIPKDKQQEIFLQFKRLTPSYKGIYKGAGLGLAVIKQFIDELDGEIYVESTVAKGTLFTCIIPLKTALLADETGIDNDFVEPNIPSFTRDSAITQQARDSSAKLFKHRILLVEDNTIAQTIAKEMLNQCNCHVDIATDGQSALQFWKKNKYDLIFMDIGLPDMDGYQVTHHIRVQEIAKNHHTPIIALTAHVGEENKQRCIESGINAVFSKPLTQKNCCDILNSFIPSIQKEKGIAPGLGVLDSPATEEQFFELSEFPLLDIKEGIKTTGTEDMLCKMLQLMLHHSLVEDITLLKKAHAQGDWEKTLQLAHKIKGGVVYVGAIRLKIACQYLERYWKSGQCDLLEKLYQQMTQVIDETTSEIQKWIKTKVSH